MGENGTDGWMVALLVGREKDGLMVAHKVGRERDGWMVALLESIIFYNFFFSYFKIFIKLRCRISLKNNYFLFT